MTDKTDKDITNKVTVSTIEKRLDKNVRLINIEPFDNDNINPIVFISDKSDQPPVSVIMPYKYGEPLHPMHIQSNDEVIIVMGAPSIGYARLIGAMMASNDYIIQTDADAIYPMYYIDAAKKYINMYDYDFMFTRRLGGFNNKLWPVIESGIICKKEAFVNTTKDILKSNPYNSWSMTGKRRLDVLDFILKDNKYSKAIVPLYYRHGLAKTEEFIIGISTTIIISLIISILYNKTKNRR